MAGDALFKEIAMSDSLGYRADLLRRFDPDRLWLPPPDLSPYVEPDWPIGPPPIDLAYPLPPSDAELAACAEAAAAAEELADQERMLELIAEYLKALREWSREIVFYLGDHIIARAMVRVFDRVPGSGNAAPAPPAPSQYVNAPVEPWVHEYWNNLQPHGSGDGPDPSVGGAGPAPISGTAGAGTPVVTAPPAPTEAPASGHQNYPPPVDRDANPDAVAQGLGTAGQIDAAGAAPPPAQADAPAEAATLSGSPATAHYVSPSGASLRVADGYLGQIGSIAKGYFNGSLSASDALSLAASQTESAVDAAVFPNDQAAYGNALAHGRPSFVQAAEGFGAEAVNALVGFAQSLQGPTPTQAGAGVTDADLPDLSPLKIEITPSMAEGADIFDRANVAAQVGLAVATLGGSVADGFAVNAPRMGAEIAEIGGTAESAPKVASSIVHIDSRSADAVNNSMVAAGNRPAWLTGTDVETKVVPAGTRYEMVVSEGQAQELLEGKLAFGGWATTSSVPSQLYARDKLAILPEFKPDISGIATIETTAPQKLNSGLAGPLGIANGGAEQVEFLGSRNLKVVEIRPLTRE
jgi:hypothetical protein